MHKSITYVAILVATLLAPQAAVGDDKSDLVEILRIYDDTLLENFTLQARVEKPQSVFTTGKTLVHSLSMSGGMGELGLSISQNADSPFHVEPAEVRTKSDEKVVHIARESSRMIHFDGSNWIHRSNIKGLEVDIASAAIQSVNAVKPILTEYGKDSLDANNLYFRYLNALGRGYSRLIETVEEYNYGADNLFHIKATGYCYASQEGIWELKVDPVNGFVVREARFTRNDSKTPTFSAACEDIFTSEVPLARKGWVSIADYRIDIELAAYHNQPDESLSVSLRRDVREFSETPNASVYLNFNDPRSDGIPVVRKLNKDGKSTE